MIGDPKYYVEGPGTVPLQADAIGPVAYPWPGVGKTGQASNQETVMAAPGDRRAGVISYVSSPPPSFFSSSRPSL